MYKISQFAAITYKISLRKFSGQAGGSEKYFRNLAKQAGVLNGICEQGEEVDNIGFAAKLLRQTIDTHSYKPAEQQNIQAGDADTKYNCLAGTVDTRENSR